MCCFKREKSPFGAGDERKIRHGLRKVEGPAVLALGAISAQPTLDYRAGSWPWRERTQ